MWVFGGNLTGLRAFGGNLGALRGNGADLWRPAAAETVAPANGHYVHSIWGDTSKLTPPRALQGNYLRITDPNEGRDSGAGASYTGGDGQTVDLYWKESAGSPSTSWDGVPTSNLNPSVTPTRVPTSLGGDPAKHEVWALEVDGNGADVWLDFVGTPHTFEGYILLNNCRTVRVSGLNVFVNDVTNIAGGYPDNNSWMGHERMINLRNMPDDAMVFFEGCNLDMNFGGSGPVNIAGSMRVDIFSTNNIASATNNNAVFVLQNGRLWRLSGEFVDPPSHCDIVHFFADSFWRYVIAENHEQWSQYQGFQHNTGGVVYKNNVPDNILHMRWYRARLRSSTPPSGLNPQNVFFMDNGSAAVNERPSLEAWETKIGRGTNATAANNSAPVLPAILDTPADGELHTLTSTSYLDARSNITRYRDYGDAGGQTQAKMLNVDGSNVTDITRVTETTDMEGEVAPASAIGNNFVHIWAADGTLLSEV